MTFRIREIVPVALLLVALAIAVLYLDPSATSSSDNRPGITLGEPVPSPTADSDLTPTPTVVPVADLPAPADWVISFFSILPRGIERLDARVALNSLDFDYPGAPFNDVTDDAWKLTAEGPVQISAPGRYAFSFEHDGEARLFVDGREAAFEPDAAAPRTLRAVFDHDTGSVVLRIEVRDTGGPFRLKVP